jgi:hypothetical protein
VLTFDICEEELATMAADGTREPVIPGTLWGDVMPSWSPYGRRLALTRTGLARPSACES